MTAELEYRLIEVRERVDTLLAKQRAARLENNKIKQVRKKSVSKQPESVKPLDLKNYQIKRIGQNSTKQRRIRMKFLGIVIIVGIFFGALEMGGGLDKAIDLMSLIFVIGVAVGHALGAKDGENKITRFGDGCVRGGWLGFLVGVSLIAGSDIAAAMEFGSLMPAMAVALLTPLYGYFFKIITMQLE
jgi:uncharacterized membrane protein